MADGRAALYPPGPAELPEAGTDAFVALKSEKATGACAVLSSPLPPGHPFEGRVHVRFHDGSGEAHVRPARLSRVWPAGLLIARETSAYRQLARSQPCATDRVVEIGAAHGAATALLAERAGSVLGLEISPTVINATRAAHPDLSFEEVDALEDTPRLLELASGATIIFVDIGGSRPLHALLLLLPRLLAEVRPRLAVVKCREMHAAAAAIVAERADADQPTAAQLLDELLQRHPPRRAGAADDRARDGARLYPLRYKPRAAPSGVLICRFHNYGDCKKGDDCHYDHEHCHYCGAPGHRALDCAVAASDRAAQAAGGAMGASSDAQPQHSARPPGVTLCR